MAEWSKYMQTPEFLESTRMIMLDPDMRELMIKWSGLKPGMKILEVGCGTTAFSRFLAKGLEGAEFVCLDLDSGLLAAADTYIRQDALSDRISLIQGDALSLPFQSGKFDAVISHTFLTNIHQPGKAISEMMRVCRPGGRIVSLTSQAINNVPVGEGKYPGKYQYRGELEQLTLRVLKAYEQMQPVGSFIEGLAPTQVPRAFADAGLWDIRMHGIGRGFSLSDAGIRDEIKIRYINLLYEAERKKFQSYCQLEGFPIRERDRRLYLELLQEQRDQQLEDVGENQIWEWMGGAGLLMSGVVPLRF